MITPWDLLFRNDVACIKIYKENGRSRRGEGLRRSGPTIEQLWRYVTPVLHTYLPVSRRSVSIVDIPFFLVWYMLDGLGQGLIDRIALNVGEIFELPLGFSSDLVSTTLTLLIL